MIEYDGIIEFVYYNRIIRFRYKMTNLGGSPHIYFDDKNGHQQIFHYRSTTNEWLYGLNRGPGWRKDFMDVLFAAMDLEREKHGL